MYTFSLVHCFYFHLITQNKEKNIIKKSTIQFRFFSFSQFSQCSIQILLFCNSTYGIYYSFGYLQPFCKCKRLMTQFNLESTRFKHLIFAI